MSEEPAMLKMVTAWSISWCFPSAGMFWKDVIFWTGKCLFFLFLSFFFFLVFILSFIPVDSLYLMFNVLFAPNQCRLFFIIYLRQSLAGQHMF